MPSDESDDGHLIDDRLTIHYHLLGTLSTVLLDEQMRGGLAALSGANIGEVSLSLQMSFHNPVSPSSFSSPYFSNLPIKSEKAKQNKVIIYLIIVSQFEPNNKV